MKLLHSSLVYYVCPVYSVYPDIVEGLRRTSVTYEKGCQALSWLLSAISKGPQCSTIFMTYLNIY